MRRILLGGIALCLLVVPVVVAQDGEPPAFESSAWQVTFLDENGNPEPVEGEDVLPEVVVFITLNEGETLIEVWSGVDIVYTPGDDGLYSGATIIDENYEFMATLEILDENTMHAESMTLYGTQEFSSSLRYERLEDVEAAVYTESERNIIEYTQFAECLGRVGVEAGRAWTLPELLVPVQLGEDSIIFASKEFVNVGGAYEIVWTQEFGQFENEIAETFTRLADDVLTYRYHAIAGGRDDCEMIYESTFTPFDGDFEALFARAVGLADTDE